LDELRVRTPGERIKRARIDVTLPSGKKLTNIWLNEGNKTIIDGASVGLLYAYEKGGYSTIYVKKLG